MPSNVVSRILAKVDYSFNFKSKRVITFGNHRPIHDSNLGLVTNSKNTILATAKWTNTEHNEIQTIHTYYPECLLSKKLSKWSIWIVYQNLWQDNQGLKLCSKNCISPFCSGIFLMSNKRPTGLNGHLSIRDFTLNSCQKGAYLHINSPIIIKNKNQ